MTPKPQTDITAKEWSLDHLAAMLRDDGMSSEKLILKDGRIEVQRVMFNGQPCVEKRYLGNLSGRQQYEYQQLQAIAGLNQVKDHVAWLLSAENVAAGSDRQSVARTPWFGLDTDSWSRLAWGEGSPFRRSVPFLLAWVRGVLNACYQFHDLGFVHCDLLPQNIVIRHRAIDASDGRYTLLMDKPFIIDLEFCMLPQKSGMWGLGQVRDGWRDDNGAPLLLTPAWHSEWICAGEVKKRDGAIDDDPWVLEREYKRENGRVVLLDAPFQHLPKVDWGVDLFSLGCALQSIVSGIPEEFLDWNNTAHKYLLDLPKKLRSYNQLAPNDCVPRKNPPHPEICEDIDNLIGVHQHNEYHITLPSRFKGPARPRSPMLSTLEKFKVLAAPKLVHIPLLSLQVGFDPVTTNEFEFMESRDRDTKPKVRVTLEDVEGYLKSLNQRIGLPTSTLAQTRDPEFRKRYPGFRLLTLDEWLLVCRAGLKNEAQKDEDGKRYAYSIGDTWLTEGGLRPEHAVYKWDEGKSRKHCLPPSQRPTGPFPVEHEKNKINAYGVRGMHGNVWELVVASKGEGKFRTCGGAWDSPPEDLCFDVIRDCSEEHLPHGSVGFRVCRTWFPK